MSGFCEREGDREDELGMRRTNFDLVSLPLENMSLNGLWAEKWAVQELKMSRCGLWVGPKKGSEAKEFNEGYNCQVRYRTREDRK